MLGYTLLTISAFQYYLQYAYGDLRLHIKNISISAILQIPLITFVAIKFGVESVALTWFILRLLLFSVWSTIIHNHFLPGLQRKWLLEDLFPTFLITAIFTVFSATFISIDAQQPLEALIILGAIILLNVIFTIGIVTLDKSIKIQFYRLIKCLYQHKNK